MQTFLNEPNFQLVAKSLDPVRLRKQFIEARQILDVLLENPTARWCNHPAVLQWKGYEVALFCYTAMMGWEVKNRGWKYEKNMEAIDIHFAKHLHDRPLVYPEWWLDSELKARIIITHRTRLYVKDPEFYSEYVDYDTGDKTKICCPHCNYFWPSHHYRNIGVKK